MALKNTKLEFRAMYYLFKHLVKDIVKTCHIQDCHRYMRFLEKSNKNIL